jgi:hypothetical protein
VQKNNKVGNRGHLLSGTDLAKVKGKWGHRSTSL